jgi:pyruvate formate lyase activating enzyme
VTNGYINPEPLAQLLPVVDAMNIDLKAMSELFYRSVCGGTLQPVLHTIRAAAAACHVEITNLLIPGENDSDEDLDALIRFVADVDPRIPLHFSKYFPHYKRETHPTDEASLWHAAEMARAELDFVYLGNIFTPRQTRCPQCDELLITRQQKAEITLNSGCCPSCGYPIYGVWQ